MSSEHSRKYISAGLLRCRFKNPCGHLPRRTRKLCHANNHVPSLHLVSSVSPAQQHQPSIYWARYSVPWLWFTGPSHLLAMTRRRLLPSFTFYRRGKRDQGTSPKVACPAGQRGSGQGLGAAGSQPLHCRGVGKMQQLAPPRRPRISFAAYCLAARSAVPACPMQPGRGHRPRAAAMTLEDWLPKTGPAPRLGPTGGDGRWQGHFPRSDLNDQLNPRGPGRVSPGAGSPSQHRRVSPGLPAAGRLGTEGESI